MGLDSVELIMTMEDFFGIQISDLEAEKVRTVHDLVDCVSRLLNIHEQDSSLKTEVLSKVEFALTSLGIGVEQLSLTSNIFKFVDPGDTEKWNIISEKIGLRIPLPEKDVHPLAERLNFSFWRPKYIWAKITMEEFLTAICAYNFDQLILKRSAKDQFEVLVSITAITFDKLGLDIYEVQPHKRFVDDFGID